MAKQKVVINGQIVEAEVLTQKEIAEVERTPKVKEALAKLAAGNADLATWLFDNKANIEATYSAGTVRRVTKQEKKALEKALAHIVETLKDDPKAKFVVDHASAIRETFKWPNQKRVKEEEKEAAVKEAFLELTDGNEELATWLIAKKDELAAAYATGVQKREVSEKTMAALRAHHEARKAAKETQAAG